MKKEMLINVSQPEECRIAIIEDGALEELYIERASQDNYVGNIYRGRIVNLEPSIQAAFVDFGVGRNGFLHISDVEPQYFRQGGFDPNQAFSGGRMADIDIGEDDLEEEEEDADDNGDAGDDDGDSDDARGEADSHDDGDNENESESESENENGSDEHDGDAVEPAEVAGEGHSEGASEAGRETIRDEEEDRGSRNRSRGGRDRGRNGGRDGKREGGREGGRAKQFQRRRQRVGARPRIKPPIQDIFRRGDEVLVQVIKEGIGNKGPTLSTYISIPGRYLVLMPALGRVGVSRKIEDDSVRRTLRDTMLELNPPKGLGFIVRTAGQDRTRKELSRDMAYLVRLWKVIARRLKKNDGPGGIYEESDMIIRTIRDIFSSDIDAIHIDHKEAHDRAKEFLQLVMPRYVNHLHLYEGKEPLFHRYKLETEIARIHDRKVPLRVGGSIVIDQTEALVAIDVNSGSFRSEGNAEETAYQLNMQAAKEIARQLRLRDLGGVIVNDFIDMRREKHRRGVERALRDALKRDRARTKILRTSPFGLIEMTRQRIRPSINRSVYATCPCCNSRGLVKTAESMAIEVVRMLMLASQQPHIATVTVRCHQDVAAYLNNRKRKEITQLEDEGKMSVVILGSITSFPEFLELELRDGDGRLLPSAGVSG